MKANHESVTGYATAQRIGESLREVMPSLSAESLAGSKPEQRVWGKSLFEGRQPGEKRMYWRKGVDVQSFAMDAGKAPLTVPPELDLRN